MNKFYAHKGHIYFDGYQDHSLNKKLLVEILNFFEEREQPRPSDFLDFKSHICQRCGKFQKGHDGIWEQAPYSFFCSKKCYKKWCKKHKKDKE